MYILSPGYKRMPRFLIKGELWPSQKSRPLLTTSQALTGWVSSMTRAGTLNIIPRVKFYIINELER